MRWLAILFVFVAFWAGSPSARAQSSEITLQGDPLPIIEATINRRTVRLFVDPRMPDLVSLNASAAERVGVRAVPMLRARLLVDEASLLASIARPNVRFANGEQRRVTGLMFRSDVVEGADGVIGPGSLPYDRVTLRFNAPQANARVHTFTLDDPDDWMPLLTIAPEITARVSFNLTAAETTFNRRAVAELERERLISAAGELSHVPLILGLSTPMQPATLDPRVTVDGLVLAPALARTNAPILSADDMEVVMLVEGQDEGEREARVSVGRAAMAQCWSLSVDRATRRLTLSCAG